MKVLGITGGMGSGKSTVCKVFSLLGIPVYEADAEVKKLYAGHSGLAALLAKHFPASLFGKEGRPDTRKFAAYFFDNQEALEKLNGLVHPYVKEHFLKWKSQQDAVYVVKEAAILFESGAAADCDKVASITAPESLRVDRVQARDQRNRSEIQKIMSNQWSDAERTSRSDYVIENDGQQMILPQILQVHKQMLKTAVEK